METRDGLGAMQPVLIYLDRRQQYDGWVLGK